MAMSIRNLINDDTSDVNDNQQDVSSVQLVNSKKRRIANHAVDISNNDSLIFNTNQDLLPSAQFGSLDKYLKPFNSGHANSTECNFHLSCFDNKSMPTAAIGQLSDSRHFDSATSELQPMNSQTTSHDTLNNSHPIFELSSFFKCPFVECRKKSWLLGFTTKSEFELHMSLHRCQWILQSNEDGYSLQCKYIPTSTKDAIDHLDQHIDHDDVPRIKSDNASSNSNTRTSYFCPIATCTSVSYCSRGTTNKAHIHEHIRKHLSHNAFIHATLR